MKRILVLQMCRLGDILQTVPMLRGLRRAHPDAEVTLVLHDLFAKVPVPGALYDRLVLFPYTRIASTLSTRPAEWPSEAARVREFVKELGSERFDLAINLTHTDLSGFLMAMVGARHVRGGIIAADRTRIVRGRWMAYFWGSQIARAQGCFNLVDVQNWAAGVPSDGRPLEMDIPEAAHQKIARWLQARGLANRPLIAVQLGASEERKRWPAEHFAEALNRLPLDWGEVILVGTSDERRLADCAAPHFTRPFHVAHGETSLTELAALLARSRLLLTNDTGTMHVATAAGAKVIDISTGPVFVHETGPYGEGHYVIEPRMECFPCVGGSQCHHFACREAISPGDVADLAACALGFRDLPHPPGARILTGRFLGSGRIEYSSAWPGPDRIERIRRAAAAAWEQSLEAPGVDRGGRQPAPVEGTDDEFRETCEALARVADEADQARRVADAVAANAAGETTHLTQLAQRLEKHLEAMEVVARLEPTCQPILAYLRTRLASMADVRIAIVARLYAEEMALVARHAREFARALEGPAAQAAGALPARRVS